MQDLAKYCQVSTATISRVLNNNGRFSENTRKMVEAAMQELGYVPNDAAKNLRKQSTKIVGIFINTLLHETVTDVLNELQTILFEHGFIPIVCNIGKEGTREAAYFRVMQSMNVCCIFMIFLRTAYYTLEKKSNIPIVFIYKNPDFSEDLSDYYILETNDFQAGELAGRELIRSGAKNWAIVRYTTVGKSIPLGRELGFLNVLYHKNFMLDKTLSIIVEERDNFQVYAAINEHIKNGSVADGYFCVTDALALSLIQVLENNHYRVPEDVRVVGCNNLSCSHYGPHPITTIAHQVNAICAAGVELLENILSGIEIPTEMRQQTFDVSLIRRETT